MALHRPGALTQTGTHPFDCPLVLSRADFSLLPLSVHRCLCHTVTFSQMTASTIEVIDTQFPCFILESLIQACAPVYISQSPIHTLPLCALSISGWRLQTFFISSRTDTQKQLTCSQILPHNIQTNQFTLG